ncbi:MAG: DUF6804 family protein [bacterium]
MNLKVIKIICAVLLLGALFNFPYVYYQILRGSIMILSGYLSYNYFKSKKENLGWIFAIIAILFNPVIPFYFGKELWQLLDVITAGVFLISFKK